MATHFARWTMTPGFAFSTRLGEECLCRAQQLPERRRVRFLASRSLLAELLFMMYGTRQLPAIITTVAGRPHFADSTLVDFSVAYAGNSVGVLVTTEGRCGLDMELTRAYGTAAFPHSPTFSRNESTWINNQNDPSEARAQLRTLRQSTYKLTGERDTLQLLPGAGRIRVANHTDIEAISDVEDLLVWACAVSPAIEKLTLWDFESPDGWHCLKDVHARRHAPDGRIIRFTTHLSEKALYSN